MTEEVLASEGLRDAIANLRDYARRHPIQDFHLAIIVESLLAALQVYAVRATDQACVIVDDPDEDDLPCASLNS